MLDPQIKTRSQFAEALTQLVLFERHDEAARLKRDLDEASISPDPDEGLWLRIRENRIYAALNSLAATFGPDCTWSATIDEHLKANNYSETERYKVRHRLERGFAREAYKPGSAVAGVPPLPLLESLLAHDGIQPTPDRLHRFLAELASERCHQLEQSASDYAAARENIAAAIAKLSPSLTARRNLLGTDVPVPPWAGADAIARCEIRTDIDDRGDFLIAPVIDKRFMPDVDVAGSLLQHSANSMAEKPKIDSFAFDEMQQSAAHTHSRQPHPAPSLNAAEIETIQADLLQPANATTDPESALNASMESAERARKCLENQGLNANKIINNGDMRPAMRGGATSMRPRAIDSLEILWQNFISDQVQKRAWRQGPARQSLSTMRLWIQIIGDQRPLQIGSADAAEFSRVILSLPSNYSKAKEWRKLSPHAIAKAYRSGKIGKGQKPIAYTTTNRHISTMAAFYDWAIKNQLISKAPCPFKGLWVEAAGVDTMQGGSAERKMWEIDHLRALFVSPLYLGGKSESRRAVPGSAVIRDALYWVPLLAAYTGARREELCQLKVGHFNNSLDATSNLETWYIDLKSRGLNLKNPESRRWIPLHRDLIALGFIEARISGRLPDQRLFEELLTSAADDKLGDGLGKKFSNYRKSTGLYEPLRDLHSFRHTVSTMLMRAGVPQAHAEEIVGHKSDARKTAFTIYDKGSTITILKAAIDMLELPVDIARLNSAFQLSQKGNWRKTKSRPAPPLRRKKLAPGLS